MKSLSSSSSSSEVVVVDKSSVKTRNAAQKEGENRVAAKSQPAIQDVEMKCGERAATTDENNNNTNSYHDLKSLQQQNYELEEEDRLANHQLDKPSLSSHPLSAVAQVVTATTDQPHHQYHQPHQLSHGILVPIMNCTLIDHTSQLGCNIDTSSSTTTAATSTVNLSESNNQNHTHSHQNIYFMMQATPIDLLAATTTTVPPPKQLKLSPPSTINHKQSTNLMATNQTPLLSAATHHHNHNQTDLNNNQTTSSAPSSPSPPGNRVVRDERRRANHNEVERRRRDNINKWIVELSKVIPDCSNDQSKHGQVCFSKGGILEKTVLYLTSIKSANQKLQDQIKVLDKCKTENELLKQQNELLRGENEQLKVQLLGDKTKSCTMYGNNQVTSSTSSPSDSSAGKLL